MIRLELLDDCDEQAWDDLVVTFEGGTIFHTLAWMRVIERLKQAEKLPVGIFDGADMIGVLPLFRVRRWPLTIVASPLGNVGYGGPLVDRSHYRDVMKQLDSMLNRLGADYVELRSLEQVGPATLTDRHYTVQEFKTYVLSLACPAQEIWTNLEGRCRNAIRKAQKNSVEIVEATDKSFLNVYYEMVKDMYSKAHRPPSCSPQDYHTVWDILRPRGRIKVLLARYEGRVVAGATVLYFHNRLYGWDRAGFRTYYSLNPNNLLDWNFIEWGARNGLTQYDMMGANIPSIARYKKSFGGELRTFTYAYKDINWQTCLGRRLYLWLIPRIRSVRFRLRPA
jgi:hypothetical protein